MSKSRWTARGRTQGGSPCSSRTLSKEVPRPLTQVKIPGLVHVDYESGYYYDLISNCLCKLRLSMSIVTHAITKLDFALFESYQCLMLMLMSYLSYFSAYRGGEIGEVCTVQYKNSYIIHREVSY